MKSNNTRGWKKVFGFTFVQFVKTKSFIVGTVILALITVLITAGLNVIPKLAGAGEFTVTEKADAAEGMMTVVTDSARVFIPMGELVDKDKELARLDKEKKAAEKDIEFLSKKLNNPGFLAKAPEQLVAAERAKLAKATEKMEKILQSIAGLQ